MKTYFTADLHFSHQNIIKYCNRPFSDSHHMNTVLTQNWNQTVEPKDRIFILGDICLNPEAGLNILRKLNGIKFLVPGNHDKRLVKLLKKSPAPEIKLLDPIHIEHIDNTFFVLCHYPMVSWEGSNRGSIHLHGHCHGRIPSEGKRLDVGVDNSWQLTQTFKPLETKEIVKILSTSSRNYFQKNNPL